MARKTNDQLATCIVNLQANLNVSHNVAAQRKRWNLEKDAEIKELKERIDGRDNKEVELRLEIDKLSEGIKVLRSTNKTLNNSRKELNERVSFYHRGMQIYDDKIMTQQAVIHNLKQEAEGD